MSDIPASAAAASSVASGGADAVYFDGAIRPAVEACFSAGDHGVLFGLGFFETFRTSGGRPHEIARHWRRLIDACAGTGIALPGYFLARDPTRLDDAIAGLLRARGGGDAVLRYTVTAGEPRGAGGIYDRPHEMLTARPLPPSVPLEGVALRVLALRRETLAGRARPKSLNHANAHLGGRELTRRAAAPSDEGLFLNDAGEVIETTRQAIAWVRGDALCFPAPELGPIASTGLAWACEQVGSLRPERASVAALAEADAVFVINGVRGVTPVRELVDETDRGVLAHYRSAGHPRIVELQRRWKEALRRTAEGTERGGRPTAR
jgi:4-amino-4-deoxychorismate lyase